MTDHERKENMTQVEDLEEGITYDQNTLYTILKRFMKMPSNKMFVQKDFLYYVHACQCMSMSESGLGAMEKLDAAGTGVTDDCVLPHHRF